MKKVVSLILALSMILTTIVVNVPASADEVESEELLSFAKAAIGTVVKVDGSDITYMVGDVDGNAQIRQNDWMYLLNRVNGWYDECLPKELDFENNLCALAADVDGNEKLQPLDWGAIRVFLNGLEPTLSYLEGAELIVTDVNGNQISSSKPGSTVYIRVSIPEGAYYAGGLCVYVPYDVAQEDVTSSCSSFAYNAEEKYVNLSWTNTFTATAEPVAIIPVTIPADASGVLDIAVDNGSFFSSAADLTINATDFDTVAIEVFAPWEATGYEAIDVEVPFGTSLEEVINSLPTTVTITGDDNKSEVRDVAYWESVYYDPTTPGTYTFRATIMEDDGKLAVIPEGFEVCANVVVAEEPFKIDFVVTPATAKIGTSVTVEMYVPAGTYSALHVALTAGEAVNLEDIVIGEFSSEVPDDTLTTVNTNLGIIVIDAFSYESDSFTVTDQPFVTFTVPVVDGEEGDRVLFEVKQLSDLEAFDENYLEIIEKEISSATVTVFAPWEATGYEAIDIEVPFGTSLEEVINSLPTTVTITGDDNKSEVRDVAYWESVYYDPTTPGTYTFRATIMEDDGKLAVIPEGFEVCAIVTVAQEPEIDEPGKLEGAEMIVTDANGNQISSVKAGATVYIRVSIPEGSYNSGELCICVPFEVTEEDIISSCDEFDYNDYEGLAVLAWTDNFAVTDDPVAIISLTIPDVSGVWDIAEDVESYFWHDDLGLSYTYFDTVSIQIYAAPWEAISYQAISGVEVPFGTSLEDAIASLPIEIIVTGSGKSEVRDVEYWASDVYDPTTPGVYTFRATIAADEDKLAIIPEVFTIIAKVKVAEAEPCVGSVVPVGAEVEHSGSGETYIVGDVNWDGRLTMTDWMYLLRRVNGQYFENLPKELDFENNLCALAADVDGNEKLQPLDWGLILDYLKKLEPTLSYLEGAEMIVTDANGNPISSAKAGSTVYIRVSIPEGAYSAGGLCVYVPSEVAQEDVTSSCYQFAYNADEKYVNLSWINTFTATADPVAIIPITIPADASGALDIAVDNGSFFTYYGFTTSATDFDTVAIEVFAPWEATGYEAIADVEIPLDTSLEEAIDSLPTTVTITGDDNKSEVRDVVAWEPVNTYDPATPGIYAFRAIVAEDENCLSIIPEGFEVIANVFSTITIDGVTYLIDNETAIAIEFDGTVTDIVIPETVGGYPVTDINDVFKNSNIKSIVLPETISAIDDYAFENCDSLTSITIPDSVTSIGAYAFSWCLSLESITIPDGVISIGFEAFSCCYSITSITIPDSVTSIGDFAFHDCLGLTTVIIPKNVTNIGEGAFWACSSLANVTIHEGVTSIGNSAFYGCTGLTTVIVPESVEIMYADSFPSDTLLGVYENSYAHIFAVENNLLHFVIRKTDNPEISYGTGVSGTVYYTDGTAASGATIDILYDDGTVKESVTTDETGAYSFTYVEVGEYTIRVTDSNGNTTSEDISVKRMNAVDVYVSGETDLVLKKGYTVSGTVSPTSVTVTISDTNGNVIKSIDATDGTFAFSDISRGSYIVKAENENGSCSTEIYVANEDVTGISLEIQAQSATISGDTKNENRDGTLSAKIWVSVDLIDSNGNVVANAKTDKDGKYTFANIPVGSYNIVATTNEIRPDLINGFDKSRELKGYGHIDIVEPVEYTLDTIILREDKINLTSVSGKVTANGTTQDCQVILTNENGDQLAVFVTDKNGKYRFANVPDGMYCITAITKVDGMGFAVITIENGIVYGDTDIKVAKADKIAKREPTLLAIPDCNTKEEAVIYKETILAEKRFYDSLSDKERKQLSEEWIEKLFKLISLISESRIETPEGITVENVESVISADEVDEEIVFTLTITETTATEAGANGITTEEEYETEKIKDKKGKDKNIAKYYDITFSKDGKNISNIQKQTDTNGKLRITMEIPEEYRGHKHYSFIHLHNGEVVTLVDLDDNPNTVTFEVDKFSTFALAYSDIELTGEAYSASITYNETTGKISVSSTEDGMLYIATHNGNHLTAIEKHNVPAGTTDAIYSFGANQTAFVWDADMKALCKKFTIN